MQNPNAQRQNLDKQNKKGKMNNLRNNKGLPAHRLCIQYSWKEKSLRLNVLIKAIIQNNIVKQAGSETKSQILQTRVINVVQGHGNRNDAVSLRKPNDMNTR